jgi:hypothetical protein
VGMVLFELGLLKNGMLIFEKKFYHIQDLNKINDDAKGQFMDAIFHLAKVSMTSSLTTLKFKQYRIVFQQIEVKAVNSEAISTFLIYAIGDKHLNITFSRKLLETILDLYRSKFEKYLNTNVSEKMVENGEFDNEISKIIGDFYSSSIDRMMNLFF